MVNSTSPVKESILAVSNKLRAPQFSGVVWNLIIWVKNTWGLLENLEIFENYWGGVENNSFVIYMQGLHKDFELKGSDFI